MNTLLIHDGKTGILHLEKFFYEESIKHTKLHLSEYKKTNSPIGSPDYILVHCLDIDATKALVANLMLVHPLSKVIISTEEKSFDYELIAFEIGCHGIVNVPDELEMLRNTFLTDELCYTKETIHSIVLRQIMHQRQSMQKCLAALTQRELQIAYLSSSGLSNCEIAEQLYISTYTVKTHMQRILKKLSVTNRTKLASILKR